MAILRKLRDCSSGATALEFAIVSLFLVLTAIGVIDFGRGFNARNDMAHAADVGARTLVIDPEASDAALEQAIRDAFAGSNPDLLTVSIATETAGGASYRAVTIGYPLSLHIPGFQDSPLQLNVERRIPAT